MIPDLRLLTITDCCYRQIEVLAKVTENSIFACGVYCSTCALRIVNIHSNSRAAILVLSLLTVLSRLAK